MDWFCAPPYASISSDTSSGHGEANGLSVFSLSHVDELHKWLPSKLTTASCMRKDLPPYTIIIGLVSMSPWTFENSSTLSQEEMVRWSLVRPENRDGLTKKVVLMEITKYWTLSGFCLALMV